MSSEAKPSRPYEAMVASRTGLRSSEWLLIFYFSFLAIISPWFPLRPAADARTLVLAVAVACFLFGLSYAERRWQPKGLQIARDWIPLALTFVAYRAMDWFTPVRHTQHLEEPWMRFDHLLLGAWGLREWIERVPLLPPYLEFCYLLVYGIAVFCIATLYVQNRRERVNRFLQIYLFGTLLAYALLPYFPSEPPRTLYPALDAPQVSSIIRRFNLWLVNSGGIHSSVFPSAHVSSAFSAAWAMFMVLPERKKISWGLLIYALSVSVATVYGRYHYAVDAIAGFGISLIVAFVALWWREGTDTVNEQA